MNFRRLGWTLGLLAPLALSPRVTAGGTSYWNNLVNLRLELAEAVKPVRELLRQRGEGAVALGRFAGPPGSSTTGGAAVAHVLAAELKAAGLAVDPNAPVEFSCDYQDVDDKPSREVAVLLHFRLRDRQGNLIHEFKRAAFGEGLVVSLFGLSGTFPLRSDPLERQETIRSAIDRPVIFTDGSRVAAQADSPFGVEVLTRDGEGWTAAPARRRDGLASVAVRKGEPFAVRLTNNAAYEVTATLTVDGLGLGTFSETKNPKTGEPRPGHLLLPAGTAVVVPGWYRAADKVEPLRVGLKPGQPADAPANGGESTVTVFFAASWAKDAPPPQDEPVYNARCGGYARGTAWNLAPDPWPGRLARYAGDTVLAASAWLGFPSGLQPLAGPAAALPGHEAAFQRPPKEAALVERSFGVTRAVVSVRVHEE